MSPRRFLVVLALLAFSPALPAAEATPRVTVDLSGPGWKLWPDKVAKWEDDELFLPPVNLAKVPVHPPTGGWDALKSGALDVAVPGTVEEYLHPGNGPAGDLTGVSWWVRHVKIPATTGPRRLRLHFDAVRLRAEVFVNRKLVGYDVIGNTPFDVDISNAARPGEEIELAVRITDPGGNFDWRDSSSFPWGKYEIPMSHGFGGITGRVRLVSCDPVYVDDIYVQNTPAVTEVNVIATIDNDTGKEARRNVRLKIATKSDPRLPVFEAEQKNVTLVPGENTVTFKAAVPAAKLWDLEHPNLYICEVSATEGDAATDSARQTFGFRWFSPVDVGKDAMFRLNGKRIVLRTAISWGFWPINGIFPTPELARQDVVTAKALGQNMLNFHRTIGHPEIFDNADELGLLFYEEPGAYNPAEGAFGEALAREKVLRMVRRDRSHPSLVIYNFINERDPNIPFKPRERADMLAAHALDPSRTITLASSWAKKDDQPEDIKANLRPFDPDLHFTGWFDNHHAGGPEVWRQNFYEGPEKYYNRTTNRHEIVYWGEEGALSSPPRLAKIKAALDASPEKGWDGPMYLDWYRQFDDFLKRKHLRDAFPTVDALTTAMGAVSLYHQGRKIETIRINDATDGYAVNGWEAEIVENHSGIVDCFRNAKADPAIMAYYNQPLYVAVKARTEFAELPGEAVVDFYAINEKNLRGPHTLRVTVRDPAGGEVFTKDLAVVLTGGDVFGELLTAGVTVPIAGASGIFRVEASLRDSAGKEVATGHDDVLGVDWRREKISGHGATWENASAVRKFLEREKGMKAPAYRDDLGPLDWVVVTRPPNEGETVDVPAENLRLPTGDAPGLSVTFFRGRDLRDTVLARTDRTLDYEVPDGAAPDPSLGVMENYGVRWEGRIVPVASGEYTFAVRGSGGARLWVDGKLLFDDYETRAHSTNRGRIALEAGKPVAIRLEFWQRHGNAQCKLSWAVPEAAAPDPAKLIARVHDEGTTLFILDRADTWMDLLQKNTAVKYRGSFQIGSAWLGGLHFVRANPLFKDLPVNVAMDWPYQAVVRNGKARSGLLLEGEQLVAGAWHSYPMALGTAVGIIPCGKGRIVVSTLDIAGPLGSSDTSASVARKLLCNFLASADRRSGAGGAR
jgi:hypothetical protein